MKQIGDPDLRMGERVFLMGMAAWSQPPVLTLHPVKRSRKSRKRKRRRARMRII